jgi:hypothetical protein
MVLNCGKMLEYAVNAAAMAVAVCNFKLFSQCGRNCDHGGFQTFILQPQFRLRSTFKTMVSIAGTLISLYSLHIDYASNA